jgi:hypothetical protein
MTKPRSLISLNIVCVSTLLTGIIFSAPCFAGDFEDGCQFYNAKNYSSARSCFERAAKQYPANWLVQYYLANTLLVSGQKSMARQAYEKCLGGKPDAQIAKYCRDALVKLGASGEVAAVSNTDGPALIDESEVGSDTTSKSKTSGTTSSAVSVRDAVQTSEQAHAAIVMRRAEEECAKIRAEAREKIKTGGNTWFIDEHGKTFVDWEDEQKHEINDEAEKRCAAIMDHAERSVAHVKK